MYIIVNHNGDYLKYDRHGNVTWTRFRWLAHVFTHYEDAVQAWYANGGDIINAQG